MQTTVSCKMQVKQLKPDTLLIGIQNKIYNAFVQSSVSKNNKSLMKLSYNLNEIYKTEKQNLILYWQAYLQFYMSIYYLKTDNKKAAEKEIDKGINQLKSMKYKNSEDYALLSLLQGFSIQFKGMRAMFISGDVKKNAEAAIALDTSNIRAYYVYASNDFYTPEKYGGGKETEKYLQKALLLPSQKVKNDFLPSWGKEESYEMLIIFYIRQKKWKLAKKYFQKGIEQFPKSYIINKQASKLVNK
jgi:hypothetical protein